MENNKSICVALNTKSYNIIIGHTFGLENFLRDKNISSFFIVSDCNVFRNYGRALINSLSKYGLTITKSIIMPGEKSKSFSVLEKLCRDAAAAELDRKSLVVALGGGVVGDIAGLMAAIYLRGIRLLQVPTSLLAMVDSSVGGKTAINIPEGKNLVGAFHQPLGVVINIETLKTLPHREYLSGLAEIIKYGVIKDSLFFDFVAKNRSNLLRRDTSALEKVILRACKIKAEVVSSDEKESGLRQILNFGHTFGHAVESIGKYQKWLHGEAVSIGMAFAAELSAITGKGNKESAEMIRNVLTSYKLPVSLNKRKYKKMWKSFRTKINTDKKTIGGKPRFVLFTEIGTVKFGCEVSEDAMKEAFERILK